MLNRFIEPGARLFLMALIGLSSFAAPLAPVNAEEHARGLRLPGGHVDTGRQVFIDLRCIHCHDVKGAGLDHPELGSRIRLTLAGEPLFVTNYATLLTAITNPRHVIHQRYAEMLAPEDQEAVEPFMLDFTEDMTVRQLLDVVAFLEERYAAELPDYKKR